jgi:hypothetical protein
MVGISSKPTIKKPDGSRNLSPLNEYERRLDMIYKEIVSILVSFALFYAFPLAALAGGAASVRLGPSSGAAAGVSVSSRHGGSRASISIRVGNRWVPAPLGYYVAPQIYESHPRKYEGQLSGIDAKPALHINGYRVLPSGWLRVQVEPKDAEILVNGFAVGTETVFGISNSMGLPAGKHKVEVRKDGFQTYQTELEVQQAREILLQVKLDK